MPKRSNATNIFIRMQADVYRLHISSITERQRSTVEQLRVALNKIAPLWDVQVPVHKLPYEHIDNPVTQLSDDDASQVN